MARMTLAQVLATPSEIDRARIEADSRRRMQGDGEDPDAPLRSEARAPSPATIRRALCMTRDRFAATIGVPVATLRNWEQGRVPPAPCC